MGTKSLIESSNLNLTYTRMAMLPMDEMSIVVFVFVFVFFSFFVRTLPFHLHIVNLSLLAIQVFK